jgi:sugar/nucleoside kinase (ribokinase family)
MQAARVSDYIVSSRAFAEQYTGKPLPKDDEGITEALHTLEGINPGCKVAVTLGSEGLVYLEDGKLVRMPAFSGGYHRFNWSPATSSTGRLLMGFHAD